MSTLVDTTTGELVESTSPEDARRLTDKIKIGVEGVWHLIEEAYVSRAWAALGYKSWDDYCTREFGTSRLRLPRENRPEVVASLRESGLSVRAIASATGEGYGTVRRALSGEPNGSPAPHSSAKPTAGPANPTDAETEVAASGVTESSTESLTGPFTPRSSVTGTDGKTYPAKPKYPAKPHRRAPLPDEAMRAAYKLRKKAESIERILSDDRFAQNKEQISLLSRSDLLYVQRVVAAALEQLPITEG